MKNVIKVICIDDSSFQNVPKLQSGLRVRMRVDKKNFHLEIALRNN